MPLKSVCSLVMILRLFLTKQKNTFAFYPQIIKFSHIFLTEF